MDIRVESKYVICGMKKIAEAIAKMADDNAEAWKHAPGDVALHAFAQAIRKTNLSSTTEG